MSLFSYIVFILWNEEERGTYLWRCVYVFCRLKSDPLCPLLSDLSQLWRTGETQRMGVRVCTDEFGCAVSAPRRGLFPCEYASVHGAER